MDGDAGGGSAILATMLATSRLLPRKGNVVCATTCAVLMPCPYSSNTTGFSNRSFAFKLDAAELTSSAVNPSIIRPARKTGNVSDTWGTTFFSILRPSRSETGNHPSGVVDSPSRSACILVNCLSALTAASTGDSPTWGKGDAVGMGTSAERVVSVAKLYHFENGMATFVNVEEADPRPGDTADDIWEEKVADAVVMSILDFLRTVRPGGWSSGALVGRARFCFLSSCTLASGKSSTSTLILLPLTVTYVFELEVGAPLPTVMTTFPLLLSKAGSCSIVNHKPPPLGESLCLLRAEMDCWGGSITMANEEDH